MFTLTVFFVVFAILIAACAVAAILVPGWWKAIPIVLGLAVLIAAILLFPYFTPCPCAQPVVETSPASVAYCDPSTVPFTDMGELDPAVTTKIEGPAIYEWWTGGTNEGVQRVDAGTSITIHGVKGHYWSLPSQVGLECAWNLHVSNYAAKPQHAEKTYDQLVVPPPADLLTK